MEALIEMALMFGVMFAPMLAGVIIGKVFFPKQFAAFKW